MQSIERPDLTSARPRRAASLHSGSSSASSSSWPASPSRPASRPPRAGAPPCKCGDTVTSNYLLGGDLGPCPAHGLIVESKVAARLPRLSDHRARRRHRAVRHLAQPARAAREVVGATVKGCRVSRFLRGIRLRAATAISIADNVAIDNGDHRTHVGYGIDVSGGSHNNLIENNEVRGNADEGIHIGTGSHKNRFAGNIVADNYRENLYLLGANGNVFVRNTFGRRRGQQPLPQGLERESVRGQHVPWQARRGSWATRATTSSSTTRSRGRACISSPTRAPHGPRARTG